MYNCREKVALYIFFSRYVTESTSLQIECLKIIFFLFFLDIFVQFCIITLALDDLL